MICVPNTDSVGVLSSPVSDQEATHHPVADMMILFPIISLQLQLLGASEMR